jgi:predicted nucleic acid-binding protein
MTDTQILVDTSLLIEYVRKQKKEQTLFYRLIRQNTLYIAAITEAATALRFDIPIATLNRKHFSRLETDFGVHLLSE